MLRQSLTVCSFLLSTAAAHADGHADVTGYALTDDGTKLVVMDSIADPAAVRPIDLADPVRAIAWRPVTGELLGFADGVIYSIDPATGAMTDQGATFMSDAMINAGAVIAFDFNNKIDAVRAVSSAGDNLVYFPVGYGDNSGRANSVFRFSNLTYANGDAMAGTTPMVFANAYTNAISGKTAAGTLQYALDAQTDALTTLDNNAGTLETIGKVTVDGKPVDLAPMGGFDIVSPEEGNDHAYAILQLDGAGTAGLYAIDLESGAATMMADLGMGGITSFAASKGGK